MPSSFRRLARLGRAVVMVVVMTAALAACSWGAEAPRDGLAPDTARFTYGGRTAEVPLTDCGREGDVVVLAGIEDDVVIQVEADLGEDGTERTGVTADLGGDGIMGAFGAEMDLGPAGEVADVRVEGDRLVIEGMWVTLDDRLVPVPAVDGGGVDGRMVARCPETDDEVAGHS